MMGAGQSLWDPCIVNGVAGSPCPAFSSWDDERAAVEPALE